MSDLVTITDPRCDKDALELELDASRERISSLARELKREVSPRGIASASLRSGLQKAGPAPADTAANVARNHPIAVAIAIGAFGFLAYKAATENG